MFLFNRNLHPFYAPDDSNTIESKALSQAAIEDFLSTDVTDEETQLGEAPEEGEETPSTGEEKIPTKLKTDSLEDDLEAELQEADEDEVVMPIRRKEVLAKYPTLFKEFPHLDKAVYREQKYSELLPTLRDARVAVDKAETLDNISGQLQDGNTTMLLQAVKEGDPEAWANLVDNYLDNLQLVDKQSYFHLLGNIVKNLAMTLQNSANNDDKTAAAVLYKFIFGTTTWEPPQKLSKNKQDDRETQLQEREVQFHKQVLDTHVSTVNTRIDNTIKAILDRNIDPRDSMNPYVKSNAIKDCIRTVENEIRKDVRFQNIIDKLWERAADSDYGQESQDKIYQAYLSKAKAILPTIIRNTRQTALKGLGTKSPNERNNPLPVGRPSSGKSTTPVNRNTGNSDKEKAKAIPKGMKSSEYLMRD